MFIQGVRLAQKFEALVLADQRFEIPAPRHLGMVVFRLRGENHLTERLLKRLNARGNLHCVPAALKGRYVIRFTVTSQRTTGDDITRDWAEIRAVAAEVLGEEKQPITAARARVPLAGMAECVQHWHNRQSEDFGCQVADLRRHLPNDLPTRFLL
jgi:histidine decarboxylase